MGRKRCSCKTKYCAGTAKWIECFPLLCFNINYESSEIESVVLLIVYTSGELMVFDSACFLSPSCSAVQHELYSKMLQFAEFV